MQDLMKRLKNLRRPPILIDAARNGAMSYNRNRHLQRVLGYGQLPRTTEALPKLLDMESALEGQRASDFAGYSLARHLDVLIATVAEAQLLRALRPVDPA